MKKFIIFVFLIIFILSCQKETKKIVHLRYDSLDTIRMVPIVINEKGHIDQITVFLSQLAENTLKESERFEFMDINNWALMRDNPNTVISINKTHENIKRIIALFQNNKMERAYEDTEKTLALLSKNFQYFEDLEEVYTLLAYQAASGLLADVIDSEKLFENFAVLTVNYNVNRFNFGPGILQKFREAKKEVKKRRKGVITVNSSPVPGKVFIDGEYVGITPYQSEKIKVGTHYVKVESDGYHPYGEVIKVLPQENPVSAEFRTFTINRELNKLRRKLAQSTRNKEKLFPKIVLKFLRVIPFDQLLLIKTQTIDEDIYVDVFIYDIPATALYKKANFKLNIDDNNMEDEFYNQMEKILNY